MASKILKNLEAAFNKVASPHKKKAKSDNSSMEEDLLSDDAGEGKKRSATTSLSAEDRAWLKDCFSIVGAGVAESMDEIRQEQSSQSRRMDDLAKENADLKQEIQKIMSIINGGGMASPQPSAPPGLGRSCYAGSDTSSAIDLSDIIYVLGNLGFNTHKDTLMARAREALQKCGADEPINLYAPFLFGSIVNIQYASRVQYWKAKALLNFKRSNFPEAKNGCVFLAERRKSKKDGAPSSWLIQLRDYIKGIGDKQQQNWEVLTCPASKQIYIDAQVALKISKHGKIIWPEVRHPKITQDSMTNLETCLEVAVAATSQ